MKIKLRNILTLSLALLSTISFAQTMDFDSRTRVNMHGDDGMNLTEQRTTIGATVGGDDWGIHMSSDFNFFHNDGSNYMNVSANVYEAYAKTSLFSFADLTVGRQAWDFGSGSIIGTNQWDGYDLSGAQVGRVTRDGMLFDIDNDMVDLSVGYSLVNLGDGSEDATYTLINAAKSFGDLTGNVLVIQQDNGGIESTIMGIDVGYSAMGGALDLMAQMNTATSDDIDYDMTMIGASYNVNDDLSIRASQTTYGENGFTIGANDDGMNSGTNMGSNYNSIGEYEGGSFGSHGNMGYLRADDVNLAIGVDYSMGDFDLSYTMNQITNNVFDDYEKEVTEFSVGYNLNDNSSLSLKYANDNRFNDDGDDWMWLSLTINP